MNVNSVIRKLYWNKIGILEKEITFNDFVFGRNIGFLNKNYLLFVLGKITLYCLFSKVKFN